MTVLAVADLTTAALNGTGVFDVLMRANKVHLEAEFKAGRFKGAEYATVYLGTLQPVLQTAMAFLVQNQEAAQKALLMEQQILLATLAVQKAQIEKDMLTASLAKIPAEIALLEAQTALAVQQKVNLVSEELAIDAKTALTVQQTESEALRNYVDGVDPTKSGMVDQERQVAGATVCKLKAEYDLTMVNVTKAGSENAFILQKKATEQAQTVASGVDVDSVVGRQKALYAGQTAGFQRDAEQKAAQILVETWKVRRTTDEGTVADATNKLNDATIGSAVTKLLTGAGV